MGLLSSKCTSQARLVGKTVVITGANTGIGRITAHDLYKRGARVIVACRNLEKTDRAVKEIKEACKDLQGMGTILTVQLDLSSLRSIRECAERLLDSEERIDVLINNAGVMMCPESKTEDGFEMQIGTNHLGHFLFTVLLLPRIRRSAPARIVNVSSMAHRGDSLDLKDLNWEKKKYSPMGAYQQSKLANILFSTELDRRLKENKVSGVNVYALHPGAIYTDLARHIGETAPVISFFYHYVFWWLLKTPEQGAQTTIYCTVDERCANESGLYYSGCAVKEPTEAAKSAEDAKKLWELSWKLVGLEGDYDPFDGERVVSKREKMF